MESHCLYHSRRPHEICYCFPPSIPFHEAHQVLRMRFMASHVIIPLYDRIHTQNHKGTAKLTKVLPNLRPPQGWKFQGGVKDATYVFAGRRLTSKNDTSDSVYTHYRNTSCTLPVIPTIHRARLQRSPSREETSRHVRQVYRKSSC